jgi:hypothetical protein
MTIYVVITTSLIEYDFNKRKDLYIKGITQIIQLFKDIPNINIVIVENTNKTSSFLDSFGIPVLYTDTNKIVTNNKGIKEIEDVFKCIKHFNMKDDDFLIKITGRYFVHDDSKFVNIIRNFNVKPYDAVLRYGYYTLSKIYMEKCYICITGLIGMKVSYVKMIEIPDETTDIERKWADIANTINEENLFMLDKLGVTQYISNGPIVDSQ